MVMQHSDKRHGAPTLELALLCTSSLDFFPARSDDILPRSLVGNLLHVGQKGAPG